MPPGGLRWVHASICLVLNVPAIAVAQVCLVLSVAENGFDWQLTQIKLQGCEISRTLDRVELCHLISSRQNTRYFSLLLAFRSAAGLDLSHALGLIFRLLAPRVHFVP